MVSSDRSSMLRGRVTSGSFNASIGRWCLQTLSERVSVPTVTVFQCLNRQMVSSDQDDIDDIEGRVHVSMPQSADGVFRRPSQPVLRRQTHVSMPQSADGVFRPTSCSSIDINQ